MDGRLVNDPQSLEDANILPPPKSKILQIVLPAAAGFLSLAALFISVKTINNPQTKINSAPKAAAACTGPLIANISADSKTLKTSVNLPAGKPTRYYVHVKDQSNNPCSVAFDVQVKQCSTKDNCPASWTIVNNWGTYRSDVNGIARIDLTGSAGWPLGMVSKFMVKPAGLAVAWSNELSINYVNSGSDVPEQNITDMTEYYVQKPGYSYFYNTFNQNFNTTSKMMIQFEQPVMMCGLPMQVWRYTKDSPDAYWGSRNDGGYAGTQTIRWFVSDPGLNPNIYPAYSNYIANYIWGFGHYIYNWSPGSPLVNGLKGDYFTTATQTGSKRYLSSSDFIPKYLLAPRRGLVPFIAKNGLGATGQPLDVVGCPTRFTDTTSASYNNDGWIIRVEPDTISISNGPGKFNYSGSALRIDYYETYAKPTPMEGNQMLRESWYLVKDIGLVKIVQKHFNRRGGQLETSAPYCKNDSDCWSDTMQSPHFVSVLENFYPNPNINVAVSSDNSNFSTNISTKKSVGYWLKVTNPEITNFTGWVEAKSPSGKIFKWRFLVNGSVFVPPAEIAAFPNGYVSCASFRTWVPNEDVDTGHEKLIPDAALAARPWSPQICVTTVN